MKCTLDKHVGSIKLLNHHFVYKTKLIKITDKKILNHPYPITEPSIQFNEPPRCITQITEIHHSQTYRDQSVE